MIRARAHYVAALSVALLASTLAHAKGAEDARGAPPSNFDRMLATDDVHDCTFTKQGEFVAATSGGLVVEGHGVFTALEGLPDTRVSRIEIDAEAIVVHTLAGTARVSLATFEVRRDQARDATKAPVARTPPAGATKSFELWEGNVVRHRETKASRTCVATNGGLFVGAAGDAPKRALPTSLPTGDVSALAGDDQTRFVGTFDRGVFVMRDGKLERIEDGSLNPNVNALAWDRSRKALWVGTARGLARCSAKESLSSANAAPFQCRRIGDADAIHAVLLTKTGAVVAGGDGTLLFATDRGEVEGVSRKKGGARFKAVWALAVNDEGELFAGTTTGLYRGTKAQYLFDTGSVQRTAMVDGGLPDDWVTALAWHGGSLVVGTYNAGVVRFKDDGKGLTKDGADRSVGYVNPNGITVLRTGEFAVSTMGGLRVGTLGQWKSIPTLGRDVTAVLPTRAGVALVSSRRGVERIALGSPAHSRVAFHAPELD